MIALNFRRAVVVSVIVIVAAIAAPTGKRALAAQKKTTSSGKATGAGKTTGQVGGGTYTLETGGTKAVFEIPKDKLITVTDEKTFVFYSIKAGYEPRDDEPYTNIPAEMSVRLLNRPIDEAMDQIMKPDIRKKKGLIREVKRPDGQVVWLLKPPELNVDDTFPTLKVVQFVPAGEKATLMIDATTTFVKGMPAANRRTVQTLLRRGLEGIKLEDKRVTLPEATTFLFGK